MVVFFLSGINLPIFLPLNPAIYRIGNTKKIMFPSSKEQDESQPCPRPASTPPHAILPFIADLQNYTRVI